jgi:hypothetical protein
VRHVRCWRLCLTLLTIIVAAPAEAQLRSDIWVTYAAFGANNTTTAPVSDNASVIVGVADMRWPIFSMRILDVPAERGLIAEILTPANFDPNRVQAPPASDSDASMDPHSRSYERAAQLRTALNHYRPALTITADRRGRIETRSSPGLSRHRSCARRLMREAVEEQIRTADTAPLRRRAQEGLDDALIARRLEPPIDVAGLLLRLLDLRLPEDEAGWTGMQELEAQFAATRLPGERPSQWTRQFSAAQEHGRSVGRAIDLLADRRSEQARICRTLPFHTLGELQSDTCRVEAVVDRRDGWPIKISIVREGRAANDATETQMRIFNRLAPLEGFAAPANPCRG